MQLIMCSLMAMRLSLVGWWESFVCEVYKGYPGRHEDEREHVIMRVTCKYQSKANIICVAT